MLPMSFRLPSRITSSPRCVGVVDHRSPSPPCRPGRAPRRTPPESSPPARAARPRRPRRCRTSHTPRPARPTKRRRPPRNDAGNCSQRGSSPTTTGLREPANGSRQLIGKVLSQRTVSVTVCRSTEFGPTMIANSPGSTTRSHVDIPKRQPVGRDLERHGSRFAGLRA